MAQTVDTTAMLVGFWKFDKVLNTEGVEVEEITKQLPNGQTLSQKTNQPHILLRGDGQYAKVFFVGDSILNIDRGQWKLASNNHVDFTMVIPSDSRQALLIKASIEAGIGKWKKDEHGNFLDMHDQHIISISTEELTLSTNENLSAKYNRVYTLQELDLKIFN